MSNDQRFTIFEDEDVSLIGELEDNLLFIHCYVDNWSFSNYKRFLRVWSEVLDFLKEKGYSTIYASNVGREESVKFAEMFGFKEIMNFTDETTGLPIKILQMEVE